jgi:hypothetical protein
MIYCRIEAKVSVITISILDLYVKSFIGIEISTEYRPTAVASLTPLRLRGVNGTFEVHSLDTRIRARNTKSFTRTLCSSTT